MALAQFATDEDKAVNITRALEHISNAAQLGVDIIVLPECFNTPYGGKYFSNPSLPEAIPNGPTSKAMSEAAHQHGIWIFGGSIPERDEETGNVYNTCAVFNRQGQLEGRFRKMHLFDIDIPDRITFRESDSFTAGSEPLIIETEFGKIGVGICYDLRFPELSLYYSEQGCFMLVFPSAFSETTGSLHWDILTRTRALDNQVFVLGCQGVPTPQYNSWGHSQVCGPMGNVLARAGREETLILVDLDVGSIQEARESIPVLSQKRFDLYNKINFRH